MAREEVSVHYAEKLDAEKEERVEVVVVEEQRNFFWGTNIPRSYCLHGTSAS